LQDFDNEESGIEFKLDSVLDYSMWPKKEITSFAFFFLSFWDVSDHLHRVMACLERSEGGN
jgi:hypothetical protein